MYRETFRWYLLVLICLAFPAPSFAQSTQQDETYYMIIFSQEGPGHEPALSHTFATFIKATGAGADKGKSRMETHTISWLPASGDVRLIRRPETGKNFGLDETLRLARSLNLRVSRFGPYQIKKELYRRATAQVKRLNSGEIAYKAIDRRFRPDSASNCFHAISDIDGDNGLLDTGTAHGDDASSMVVMHLRRWIIRPDEAHDWIVPRLGLGDSGIRRLKLDALSDAR